MSHKPQNRNSQAFTLADLLVVITVVTVLATVALATQGQGSSEHVLRAQCASNLRLIGQALNVYAVESDDYLPICGMNGQNSWYTYEVARVVPGTTNLTRGFMNIGLLVRTRAIQDARALYCPAQANSFWTYDYYAAPPNAWPSTPVGSGDDNVRVGYCYYPQLRVMEYGGRGILLPKLTTEAISLEYGSGTFMAPVKLFEVNPQKSITTDLVHSTAYLSHTAQGTPTGLNALFPDGAVVFQDVRTMPNSFNPTLWGSIGTSTISFRKVLSLWEQ